jgi:murein L,D-transpeptidase YcbB/YkuD
MKTFPLFKIFLLLLFTLPYARGPAISSDPHRPVQHENINNQPKDQIIPDTRLRPATATGSEHTDTLCNGYSGLQQALHSYMEIASQGGWPFVTKGASLKEGDTGERVKELRRRLIVTGDLFGKETRRNDIFDGELKQAVIRFQKRHGLKEDGIAGNETIKSLNVPVEERTRQIGINIERLREITGRPAERCVTINIAAFGLEVTEVKDTVMSMKVIVGKPYWHTPLFSAEITHLVFNPSWYVPRSIAVREILPKITKEPDYLSKEGFKVFLDNRVIDISTVNWADVTADNFQYRFVQVPGPENPLGKIKFVFPNRFNVYLHDTPARVLFEKSSRAFSHGCIRIEKPVELAEYLLRDAPSWTSEKILAAIDSGKEAKVRLPSPVSIYILYITAWVDKYNILHFRNDIYGRDR